ncbi:hypothetical protein S40288_04305 [Stachybotrys chartarum IBT 40288]|nr:hypothetical protein S40288_04305 [Stachybotrys chartarum IBT 40288]
MSDTASNTPGPAAEDAQDTASAIAAAVRQMEIEVWTLYAIGVCVTILRTYARLKSVGIRNFRADDFLVWGAVLFYSAQTALAHSIVSAAHGVANNGMSDDERAALPPNDPEYHARVLGSKIQLSGWLVYSTMQLLLKLSMLIFFLRLTEGLGSRYRRRIWLGCGLVAGTYIMCVLVVFLSCRPFEHYWQISPDPGNSCQAAISLPIVWSSFATNIVTDLYLIVIPIPLLWGSTLKVMKKIASTIILCAGIFVLVCATLKSIFVLVDPENGARAAGQWGTRETFVAVVTTNLPMIFPLLKTYLTPVFGTMLRSRASSRRQYQKPRGGVQTIGSSGKRRSDRGGSDATAMTGTTLALTESEERAIRYAKSRRASLSSMPWNSAQRARGILVSSEFRVTSEDGRYEDPRDAQARTINQSW